MYIPEVNNNIVFTNGKPYGSIHIMPLGGHVPPTQILGDKLK